MKKEYGGYIELDNFKGQAYYKGMLELNCGRSCLSYLIEVKGIKKIYIPLLLCDSVKECCKKYGVEVKYYNIDKSFNPVLDGVDADEYVYIVNYYGQLGKEDIRNLKERFNNLIVDNSEAFFSERLENIDTIYVCRKFFGVADGAYLFTEERLDRRFERDVVCDRMSFLLGRYEKSASEYYSLYAENNDYYKNLKLLAISKLSENILKALDYEDIKNKRNTNYNKLDELLGSLNQLELKQCEGPYAYPFLVKNGAIIRKKLIENKIYIPLLWPEVLDNADKGTLEYEYANSILPLPVDQRYDESDMKFIAETVKSLIEQGES